MEEEIQENPLTEEKKCCLPCCLLPWWKIVACVAVGLIIITGAVYAGYFLGRKSISPRELLVPPKPTTTQIPIDSGPVEIEVSPTPEVRPDETANWKTYKNDFAKFSLEYPSSMSFSEKTFTDKEKQVVFIGPGGKLTINMAVPTSSGWGGGCDPQFHQEVNFLGKTTSACLSDEWLNQLYGYHPSGYSQVQIAANFASPFSQNKKIILQILSTFKFLD